MKALFRLPVLLAPDKPELERHARQTKEAIEDGGRRLESVGIIDGHLLEDIELPITTNTAVNHKLGRKIQGWIITDRNAGGSVRRISVSGEDSTKQLTLYATASITIDLWVF